MCCHLWRHLLTRTCLTGKILNGFIIIIITSVKTSYEDCTQVKVSYYVGYTAT